MELDVTDTPHPKPGAEAVGADKRQSAKVRPAPPADGEEVVDLEKGEGHPRA
jgi:hypothetical protein